MKLLNYILSVLSISSVLILASSCNKEDDAEPTTMTSQQKATKALVAGSPWTVKTVVAAPDGTDESLLNSLEIEFGATGADQTIAPGAFEISIDGDYIDSDGNASWSWSGSETSTIVLTGATVSELKDISFAPNAEDPTSVTVSFNLTELGGRRKGLGEYTVTLE